MAQIGQIWVDPTGVKYLVTAETDDSVLIGGQWLPKDLEGLGYVLDVSGSYR